MHGSQRRLAIRCRQAAVRGRCPMGVQAGITGAGAVARAPVNPRCLSSDARGAGPGSRAGHDWREHPAGAGGPVSSGLRPDTGGNRPVSSPPPGGSCRRGGMGQLGAGTAPGAWPARHHPAQASAHTGLTQGHVTAPALALGGSPAPGAGRRGRPGRLPHQMTLPAPPRASPGRRRSRDTAAGAGNTAACRLRQWRALGREPSACAAAWPFKAWPGRLDSCQHSPAIVSV
jgi:hypothetical protein